MSWNTTALRNYFVVLFKGYVLQLIPAHHDIYKSAFCKKATNLGEKRKHPEFKVILAVLLEICVCQRRKIWKAQGRGRAEELWSSSWPLLWDRWTDRSLRWPQATHPWGWQVKAVADLCELMPATCTEGGLWTPSRMLLREGSGTRWLWRILPNAMGSHCHREPTFCFPHQSFCGKWSCDVPS